MVEEEEDTEEGGRGDGVSNVLDAHGRRHRAAERQGAPWTDHCCIRPIGRFAWGVVVDDRVAGDWVRREAGASRAGGIWHDLLGAALRKYEGGAGGEGTSRARACE